MMYKSHGLAGLYGASTRVKFSLESVNDLFQIALNTSSCQNNLLILIFFGKLDKQIAINNITLYTLHNTP